MISCILLLEYLSASSALLRASAARSCHTPATPHPSACALFQKSRRSTRNASRTHLPCFRSVSGASRFLQCGIPLFQERPGSVTLFQKRYRSVRGASVRREGEVLKRRRGGVLSLRTQEVLTGTEVKEMPPGCPGGVKVWIFRQNWPERGILTSTMPKISDRVMAP